MILDFESLTAQYLSDYEPELYGVWYEVLGLPQNVVGFGPVKLAHAVAMEKRRSELLNQFVTVAAGAPKFT